MNRRFRLTLILILVLASGLGIFAFGVRGPGDPPPPSETLRLEVDVSARTVTAVEDGEPTRTFEVTVGSRDHPTPRGRFAVDWIVWNPSWTPPDSDWARGEERMEPGPDNPMGRVKMYFRDPGYYIHGTDRVDELGEAASHGCVRMRNQDVIELARLVMEHGGEARSPNWFKRVINRFRDTREVTLESPVPVNIDG